MSFRTKVSRAFKKISTKSSRRANAPEQEQEQEQQQQQQEHREHNANYMISTLIIRKSSEQVFILRYDDFNIRLQNNVVVSQYEK